MPCIDAWCPIISCQVPLDAPVQILRWLHSMDGKVRKRESILLVCLGVSSISLCPDRFRSTFLPGRISRFLCPLLGFRLTGQYAPYIWGLQQSSTGLLNGYHRGDIVRKTPGTCDHPVFDTKRMLTARNTKRELNPRVET